MADPDNLIIQIILEKKNEKKEKCKTQEEKGIIHIQYYLYIRPPCPSGSSVRLVSPSRPGPIAISAGYYPVSDRDLWGSETPSV